MKKYDCYFKKLIIFLLLIIQMLTQTSCAGDKKQIQKLFMVVAMGVDINPDGKYEVTMQVLNPTSPNQTMDTSSSAGSNDILIYSGIGETFYEAVMELSKTMRRVHHFGHLNYIVIGEALAQGEQSFLADSLFRQDEIRLNTPILVTKGKASEIVSARTKEGAIPADVVKDLLDRQELVGYRPFTYLLDIVNEIGSKTTAPILAVIELVKPEDKLGSETFKLSGTAVFKEGKLIGYLNAKETRGSNWIRGKVELGNITVTCPSLGKVSLEILDCSSKIKPVINGGHVSLKIQIKTSSVIRGINTSSDPVKKPEIMDEVGRAENKAVEEEVKSAIRAAKDNLGADIFGFGEKIHASYPKEWSTMEKDWDSIYQNMNIDIVVDSKIRTTGSILKSIK